MCPTSPGARIAGAASETRLGALPGGDRRARPRGACRPAPSADPAWFWAAAVDDLALDWQRRADGRRWTSAPASSGRPGGAAAPSTTPRRRSIGGRGSTPTDPRIVWEGEDGEVRALTTSSCATRWTWRRRCSGRTACGPATASGSCCRCSSRPWSPSWPWASWRPSSRPSSRATAPRPSPRAWPIARPRCSSRRIGFVASRRHGAAQGDRRCRRGHGADRARGARRPTHGGRRVPVARTTNRRHGDVPWTTGRDHWWHEALAAPGLEPLREAPPTDPETPYMIIYTSGTTGRPKGARPRPRRLPHQGRPGPRSRLRPAPRRPALLVHGPGLDDGSLGHQRGAAAGRRRSSSTRARPTSPAPTGCGPSPPATP